MMLTVWSLGAASVALIVCVLQRRKLVSYRTALSTTSAQAGLQGEKLRAIFTGMADGIMVLDAEYKLQDWNAHFPTFVGLDPNSLGAGMDIEEILRAQANAGEFGKVDVEAEVARRTARFRSPATIGTVERTRPDGRVIELRRSPMPGHGIVTLYTDITKRRQAEQQLQHGGSRPAHQRHCP